LDSSFPKNLLLEIYNASVFFIVIKIAGVYQEEEVTNAENSLPMMV
jgi:hypothetical protein